MDANDQEASRRAAAARLRCPHCGHVFAPQDRGKCPACGRVVLIPPALRRSAATMRDRCIRLSRDRRDRLWRLRRGLAADFPRRFRLRLAVVALILLGVILPSRYMVRQPNFSGDLPPDARTVSSLWALRTAIECFRRDCGRYPTAEEGLRALVLPPGVPGWRGPYVALLKRDPWRHDYRYACTTGEVTVASAGPDGEAGTADDIFAPPPDMTYVNAAARTNDRPADLSETAFGIRPNGSSR